MFCQRKKNFYFFLSSRIWIFIDVSAMNVSRKQCIRNGMRIKNLQKNIQKATNKIKTVHVSDMTHRFPSPFQSRKFGEWQPTKKNLFLGFPVLRNVIYDTLLTFFNVFIPCFFCVVSVLDSITFISSIIRLKAFAKIDMYVKRMKMRILLYFIVNSHT